MAVSVDRYKAESYVLVGLLTPFFINGRKVMKFLSAIASPLDDDNDVFCEWAKDEIADSVATSQPVVLTWYLDQKLGGWFADSTSHFAISQHTDSSGLILYEDSDDTKSVSEAVQVYALEDNDETLDIDAEKKAIIRNIGEGQIAVDEITVLAPPHNMHISDSRYERLIKQLVTNYLVYPVKYFVKIRTT